MKNVLTLFFTIFTSILGFSQIAKDTVNVVQSEDLGTATVGGSSEVYTIDSGTWKKFTVAALQSHLESNNIRAKGVVTIIATVGDTTSINSAKEGDIALIGSAPFSSILVRDDNTWRLIEAASELNDISDVTLTSPSSGQVLKYNGSTWVNSADATGGGESFTAIKSETISYSYDGLTLYASVAYDSTSYNLPICVVMHGFSQAVSDFQAGTIARFAGKGVFALFVEMRGRGSSTGTEDAGGLEIQDIWAAVEHVKTTYAERVDPRRVSIVGYSGGGGNVYSSVTKFPYHYNVGVSFFGIADYGSDGTNGWYQNGASGAQQTLMQSWIGGTPGALPNNYEARNSLRAIGNYPGRLILYHDQDDASVPIIQTTRLRDTADYWSVPDVYVNISQSGDALRWTHGLPDSGTDLVDAEDYFIPAIRNSHPLTQPTNGRLTVKGYIYTPEFRLTLGTGLDAYGDVVYDALNEVYTITQTPSDVACSLELPRQGRASITAVINGDTITQASTGDWTSFDCAAPIVASDTLPVKTNLLAWYRADTLVYSDSGTTLATNGGTVQQWNDLSGNGHNLTQTTTGAKPTYHTNVKNSLPVVRLDGTDDRLLFPGTNSASNYTMFFVVNPTNASSGGDATTAEYFFDSETGRFVVYHFVNGATPNMGYFDGTVKQPATAATGWQVTSFDLESSASASIRRNGSVLSSGGSYTQKAIGGTSAFFARYADSGLSAGWFQGDAAEIIIYNTSLNDVQIAKVTAYLNQKWGVY